MNGEGATGVNCEVHGDSKCSSCNSNYDLLSDACVPYECVCDNGNAASFDQCDVNGSEQCADCSSGYYLNGQSCELNVCTESHQKNDDFLYPHLVKFVTFVYLQLWSNWILW